MQDQDWNDLKHVLAVHRAGSLAGAGRILGLDETTVARRLKRMERSVGAPLFVRRRSGRYEATDMGLAVVASAERIEREALTIPDRIGQHSGRLFGTVRITAVPMVVNRILVPNLATFRAANPGVTVELVPEARNLSLSRREADLALRLGRPEAGGLGTKAQRIGALSYGVYGPASVPDATRERLDWIGYDDAHAHLPQARWLARAAAGADLPGLRVCDAETALEAVASGLGRTLLPGIVADRDPRLRLCDGHEDLPVRGVWLLSLDQNTAHAAISAGKEWLRGIVWSRGGNGRATDTRPIGAGP